ncbi:heavy metal-associated isoprenylated plant protein 9-like [Aristolochia californica]|uniref:heavy metal-associated isoprenylated plant protein 9-like n=1 Tax=Aristolochia californica TaxID=171875 RepID=UPI0035DFDC26
MGEAKPEDAKDESKPEEKKEEKVEEKKVENTEKAEEKKEVAADPPPPPPPVVLFVDMHCVGCAKRVERCIMKVRGVEEVKIDMTQNHITIKGIVDPQALCMRIQKKTNRMAQVISPLPPPEADPTKPQIVTSQVSEVITVVLHINMHCEACAEQLKRKILKMRGVQSAETELSSGKVTVTGTMDANRLVEYVYRRTKKLAKIVLQPEEEKEETKKEAEKPAEESPKAEEKKEEMAEKKEDEKEKPEEEAPAEKKEEEKPAEAAPAAEEAKKEVLAEEMMNYWNFPYDDMGKKVIYCPPVYAIERVPPPQLFSDENPNACCIS